MSFKEHPPHQIHVPVLLDASINAIHPRPGESYLDLTAGYGGHADAFLGTTKNFAQSVLVDRDQYAIEHLERFRQRQVELLHCDFITAARLLIDRGMTFNIVLADLGVSSPQLDQGTRGFSFMHDGPLDMRMDRRQPESAATLLNSSSKDELTRIIIEYGEERPGVARTIADAIIAARPLASTAQLARVIEAVHRGPRKRIHPATRTFQALRIAVNQELAQVESLMPLLPKLLAPGGRIGIISFHSLEDRIVKRYFADQRASGLEAELDILTKKPLAGSDYDVHNPRSRSAKLRVAVKK